uniref:F-box/FBD/LRR-repeat protein At5g22660-like n=1 Tax=Rhizophora mucronata TaxID=61149 RepID=A0A2P2IPI0_RHIMU
MEAPLSLPSCPKLQQ